MQIEGAVVPYKDIDAQGLAVAVFKDEKADEGFLNELDSLTQGAIRSVIASEELKGKEAETVYFPLLGTKRIKAQRLLLVGVGERRDYTAAQVSQLAGTAARFLRGKNVKSFVLVPRLENDPENTASMVVQGAITGLFEPDKYRTIEKEKREIERLIVVVEGAEQEALNRGIDHGQVIGTAVNFTRDRA